MTRIPALNCVRVEEICEWNRISLRRQQEQDNEIRELRARLSEVTLIAHEQNRLAAVARSDAETVRQLANVEHI
eukprot:5433512-Heterocapsa_arctica.AAC.1